VRGRQRLSGQRDSGEHEEQRKRSQTKTHS
jgi:hypothetical protein